MAVRHCIRARELAGLLALACITAGPLGAGEMTLEVAAGETDRVEAPVCAEIALPADLAETPPAKLAAALEGPEGKTPGQLLPSSEKGKALLWWTVSLKAGQKATYRAAIQKDAPPGKSFAFQDEPGKSLDLTFDGRKVARLMYAHDFSTKEKRFETYKVFTHVFDSKGERLITNGHGQPFPHHRGIFIGWNRTALPDGKTRYDFWHMPVACQRLDRFAAQDAGPVLGRLTAVVNWEDPQGKPVLVEERQITVYRQSRPDLLLDFVSTLRSGQGDIALDGDPEHAGCQFRAHSDLGDLYKKLKPAELKEQGKETRYLLPPGMKEGTKGTPDMPWASVALSLGEQRFGVAQLNHPGNPKGTIYSANRAYGRFGAFAKATVKADAPLVLRYRFFVREGPEALTADDVQRLYADFAKPPEATARP